LSFISNLQKILEEEEKRTVSNAFGGPKTPGKTLSFSVTTIRDEVLKYFALAEDSDLKRALLSLQALTTKAVFGIIVGNSIRFSFLIELTNLTIGSTKMKTRWLPGKILMSQQNSFEPVQGTFKPGNDIRAASFQDCLGVFMETLNMCSEKIQKNKKLNEFFGDLQKFSCIPYEFLFDYKSTNIDVLHNDKNIVWILNKDIIWLINARRILKGKLPKDLKNKINTKTYKTDRALTGKDKTNRAKRMEVLPDDFQYASLTDCWSVERKLLEDLLHFRSYPKIIKDEFITKKMIQDIGKVCLCPITYFPFDYKEITAKSVHGKSEFQVGHLHPLKRGGRHTGNNVCWVTATGNRIQGDLTVEETSELVDGIYERKNRKTK